MMHKLISAFVLIALLPFAGQSQYYQKDILSTRQTMEQIKQYKANKVRKVVLQSFEGTGEPVEQFICFQEISPSFNIIKTFSQTMGTMQSVLVTQFNAKGQLIRSADSSNTTLNVSSYTYDAAGRLAVVENVSQAYAYKTKETVRHQYTYDSTGLPVSMLRIKNGTDTVVVQFKADEKGNVGEEIITAKGKETQTWYYYYDAQNRLTDIVRFNDRARRLLPDYVYEYNEQSQLTQMISVQSGGSDYVTWRYQYNPQGLKIKESCFSKQKQLMGYVTYRYE
jgi:YD repeat-containing protein